MTAKRREKWITDKMRLDFVRQFGVGNMGNSSHTVNSPRFFWPGYDCTKFCGGTFRSAIDAAIRAARRQRGQKK